MVFFGKVINTDDSYDAGRIKVRVKNADISTADADLPYAFPLMPKMVHVTPKVGEAVVILCQNDNPRMQRFYIGPIISQYQNMFLDYYETGALKMLDGPGFPPQAAVSNIPVTYGAFGNKDDVIIYGRKNSDIILSDTDLRIRCGARLTDNESTTRVRFNKTNPSVIKLKYHEKQLNVDKPVWNTSSGSFSNVQNEYVESSVNVIAQEINLISTQGTPYVNTSNNSSSQSGNESISDEDIKKFIEKAHPIPYGDTLIKLLHLLIRAFKSHTHAYTQLPPVQDENYTALDRFNISSILSKNIRIN